MRLSIHNYEPRFYYLFVLIVTVSSMDFTDYGCVVIVVMTHGGKQGLLMAKDKSYSEQDILNYFTYRKNPKLVTKPIIVIIQVSLDWSLSSIDGLRRQQDLGFKFIINIAFKETSNSLLLGSRKQDKVGFIK